MTEGVLCAYAGSGFGSVGERDTHTRTRTQKKTKSGSQSSIHEERERLYVCGKGVKRRGGRVRLFVGMGKQRMDREREQGSREKKGAC